MCFQKNIRTICSKSTEKLPQDKIALEASRRLKNEVFQILPNYISIDWKIHVLSEKYKNHVLKTESPLREA